MAIALGTTSWTTANVTSGANVSHAGDASAAAVCVVLGQDTNTTDSITSVTYGGVTLSRVRSDSEATEAGRIYIYWGIGIPGGTQDIVVTHTATNLRLAAATMTVAAGMTVALCGSATGTSASTSNPTFNITTPSSVNALIFYGIHSGLQTMTNTPTAPSTLMVAGALGTGSAYDAGATGRGFATRTTTGGTVACAWTAATADDFVGSAAAFREFPAVGLVTETETAFSITPVLSSSINGGKGYVRAGRERGRFPTRDVPYRPKPVNKRKLAFLSAAGVDQDLVAVGQATETDTSQAIGKQKRLAVGLVIGTNTAQPITRQKRLAIGLATSTNTAQSIGRQKRVTLGLVTGTNTAQPITGSKSKTLGIATETDGAFSITANDAIQANLGLATETDTAQSITGRKQVTLGLVTETDTAFAIGKEDDIWVNVGQAAETDTAQSIGRQKRVTLGLATETDSAFGITQLVSVASFAARRTRGYRGGRERGRYPMRDKPFVAIRRRPLLGEVDFVEPIPPTEVAVGQAQETETAQPITARKQKTIGYEIPGNVQPLPGTPVFYPSERDTAQPITVTLIESGTSVGQATETDTAQAVGRQKRLTLGLATSTNTSQTITRQKRKTLGLVTDGEIPQAIGRQKRKTLGIATSTNTAQSIQPKKIKLLGQATETDFAFSIAVDTELFSTDLVSLADVEEFVTMSTQEDTMQVATITEVVTEGDVTNEFATAVTVDDIDVTLATQIETVCLATITNVITVATITEVVTVGTPEDSPVTMASIDD
jgi:hypothetical protein